MTLPVTLSGLMDKGAYPHPCGRIELIETHFSWVLLTGDYAYKLKKPETQCQAGGFAARLQVLFLQ